MSEKLRSDPDNGAPQPEPQPQAENPSVISEIARQARESLAAKKAESEKRKSSVGEAGSDTVELNPQKDAGPGDTAKAAAGDSKPDLSTEPTPPSQEKPSMPGEDEISPDEHTIDVKFWPAGTKEPEDAASRETLRLTHEKGEDAPTIPEEFILSPEQIAEKKFRKEYSEEREKQIIEEGVRQRMSDPSFTRPYEAKIIMEVMARVDLSDTEVKSLEKYRKFPVKGFNLDGADISAKELAGLIVSGQDMADIRKVVKHFFGGVTIPGKDKMTDEEFETLVNTNFEKRMRQIAENEVKQEFERRKDKWINEQILHDKVEQEQKKADAAEEKRKAEAEEKTRQRVEASEALSPEEKTEKVKRAAYLWQQTYKIDRMLREKKYTDKFGYKKNVDGKEKTFLGKDGKKEAKADKNAMSKELVALAQEISGRDFKDDAKAIKKTWNKKDLEKYITDQVEAVLTESGITFTKEEPVKSKIMGGFKAGQESLKTHDVGMDLGEEKVEGTKLEPDQEFILTRPEADEELSEDVMSTLEEERGIYDISQDFFDDFQQGKAYYRIETKIPYGRTFKGRQETDAYAESYEIYDVYSPKGEDNHKVRGGARLLVDGNRTVPVCGNFSPDDPEDAIMFLSPVDKIETKKEEVKQTRRTWFGLGKKEEIIESEREEISRATIGDIGYEGEGSKEELWKLFISYANDDRPDFKDERDKVTNITLYLKQSQAAELQTNIRNNPNNLWEFIRYIEPELIDLTLSDETIYGKTPKIVIYSERERGNIERDKPDAVVGE